MRRRRGGSAAARSVLMGGGVLVFGRMRRLGRLAFLGRVLVPLSIGVDVLMGRLRVHGRRLP